MNIDIRAATEKDLDFLLEVRRQALQTYVLETWGRWDETRQRTYLVGRLDSAIIQIIQGDGVDIGMLAVEERADEIFIENVALLPAYQNRGIVLSWSQKLCRKHDQKVFLFVSKCLKSTRHVDCTIILDSG